MAVDLLADEWKMKYKNVLGPRTILLFSGKRKCGKDYVTNALQERLGQDNCVTIKLSGPIKSHWSNAFDLDMNQLVGDGKYKETYRHRMAKWGEDIRRKDYGYFCRAAIDMYNAYGKPTWIVSDARRKTDIKWFAENFGSACKTVRVVSDDSVRMKRGWEFVPGIDDAETECDLDDVATWDLIAENNHEDIEFILQKILELINEN
ncbi:phosphomevalonate kinase [Ceratina calcarata]|uniref:Phosphomevalonate kinase n=1 Tax=Ceratina calcarata TaxID=156304 RepID=A0AAJ7JDP2_9HYME|nr:phosphomevalonate kinase [Ceratina calcarata]